jgi:hypothetical protein
MRALKIIVLGLAAVTIVAGSAIAGDEYEMTSGLKTKFYGYIKLDMSYDTGLIDTGDFARWVNPGEAKDGQFDMTARQTRFGWKFAEPGLEGKTVTGRIEFDFYGGGSDNKRSTKVRTQWAG